MTYEELKTMHNSQTSVRKKSPEEEHQIQCACITWFRLQYPKFSHVIFAVPNGGLRSKVEAKKLKAEGTTAGVSDLILLKSNRLHGALCIEMKTEHGTQSDAQKAWQKEVEANGNKYVVCHSLEEFMIEVKDYLNI